MKWYSVLGLSFGWLCLVSGSLSAAMPSPANLQRQATGTVEIDGHTVHYQSLVETSYLHDGKGKPTARLVSFSYLKRGTDRANRPVLFVFNGGPGSASIWLHLGLVGPKRVDMDGADQSGIHPPSVPPFRLVDNHESVLDTADIVLFDPPGTGYSRILPGVGSDTFYGVQQDAAATADFIEDWCRRHGRENSPKYLLGESYGTIRAAVVARILSGGPFATGHMDGVTLNGVLLFGPSLEVGPQPDWLVAVELFPTLAASAWYHHLIDAHGQGLTDFVHAARAFAEGPYLQALYQGSYLSGAARQGILDQVAAFTGLPKSLISNHALQVSAQMFSSMALADQGRYLGFYDSRFSLADAGRGHDPVADDAAMGQYAPAYIIGGDEYLHQGLKIETSEVYQGIDFRGVNARWDYSDENGSGQDHNYANDLAMAMDRNPALRLFVGSGYYDMVTPMEAAWYSISHAGIPVDRVSFHYYESGHMTYIGLHNREKTSSDIRKFIEAGESHGGR